MYGAGIDRAADRAGAPSPPVRRVAAASFALALILAGFAGLPAPALAATQPALADRLCSVAPPAGEGLAYPTDALLQSTAAAAETSLAELRARGESSAA